MPEENIKISETEDEAREENIKKLHLWIFLGLLFFLTSLALSYGVYRVYRAPGQGIAGKLQSLTGGPIRTDDSDAVKAPDLAYRILDGLAVEKGRENPYPVAVMIDNHADARPQAGLADANLVYEAEAEGGLTRYMAVYADFREIGRIGPVRSARPYFVDWAREFGALYAHVGGSPEALAYMAKDNVLHINEFYNGAYFWRDKERAAPHNVITSGPLLEEYLRVKGLDQAAYFGWLYGDETPLDERPASSTLTIDLKMKGYLIEWRYDRENNAYVRYLGGLPHRDESGRFITAKNIVVQTVPATVLDDYLRLRMDTVGTGEARLCKDGACQSAVWRKNNVSARTRYFDGMDNELSFNRGTTWVEVVSPGTNVTP